MLTDSPVPPKPDLPGSAKERFNIGPIPAWVVPCAHAIDFKAKQTGPLTYLLLDRQIHAEHRQTFFHEVMRLETMQAVQHRSQWRVEFEPRTELITLHSIKIRRGDLEIEHAAIDKFHFLQRESGLEGFVLDGCFTLLLLLEDVRPGDILEWSYTIEYQPGLLPDRCADFLTLPAGIAIGKFHFSVLFDQARQMKWKSSSTNLTPIQGLEQGKTSWVWTGDKYDDPAPEENIPEWCIATPWIQISDCPDWGTVASAFANAWKEQSEEPAIREIAAQIKAEETDILLQVEKAIRLVQDDHRYLSVNMELGGQIPTPPATVARRRYGDCKDLSFLLVHLLRQLGIPSRPILVHTQVRKSIAELLPMPYFNHVVVEYQVQDQTRWVDATFSQQGGGCLNRLISDFGVGLPVDVTATDLVKPPQASIQASLYELKETILLDTTGSYSLLSIMLTAHGSHADGLRQEFKNEDVESIAKRRLQVCANRYMEATRVGTLKHRDDRDANVFVLAEVFEINGFLRLDPVDGTCFFQIPTDLITPLLRPPEIKPNHTRKFPYALPYPCKVVHIVEVQSPAIHPETVPPYKSRNSFVQYSRSHKGFGSYCLLTSTFTTLVDAVQPARLKEYRKEIDEIWMMSGGRLHTAIGYAHPRKRSDFGELPLPRRKDSPKAASIPLKPTIAPVATTNQRTDVSSLSPIRNQTIKVEESAKHQEAAVANKKETPGPHAATPAPSEEWRFRKVFHDPPQDKPSRRKRSRKSVSLIWPAIIAFIIISLLIVFGFALRGP